MTNKIKENNDQKNFIEKSSHFKEEALLTQWKEFSSYVRAIEDKFSIVFTVLLAIFGGILTYFKGKLIPSRIFDLKFILLIIFPLAMAAIIAYTAYYFRLIAISRMYLIYIEKEINRIVGKNLFTWNSNIIDNFLAKNNFSNKLLPIIIIIFFLLIGIIFGISMCISDMRLGIKIGYCLYIAILLSVSAVPFGGNKKVRKTDYDPDK